MRFAYNNQKRDALTALFQGKANPFNEFRSISEEFLVVDDKVKIHAGYTNVSQCVAISKDRFNVEVELVITHTKSTRQTEYVILRGVYNAKTERLTQIQAATGGEYCRTAGTSLVTRKTGTVSEILTGIAKTMRARLVAQHESYWKGFADYCSAKSKAGVTYFD